MQEKLVKEAVEVALALAMRVSKGERGALPRWKQRIQAAAFWLLGIGVFLLGFAFLFKYLGCEQVVRLAGAIALGLVLLGVTLLLVGMVPSTTFKRALISDVTNRYSAVQRSAVDAYERIPVGEVWHHATQALDGVSRTSQQWQAFCAAVIAATLSIVLAMDVRVCGCGSSFFLYRAFFTDFPYQIELCRVRAAAEAFLIGATIGLFMLQKKISDLMKASDIARHVLVRFRGSP